MLNVIEKGDSRKVINQKSFPEIKFLLQYLIVSAIKYIGKCKGLDAYFQQNCN